MIIFVNNDDPHIIAGWNEFAVLNNLCQSSTKIWLINLVYEFVFAIEELKLEIYLVVIFSSSVEEFYVFCSEVSIRWHHEIIVKMFVSSLGVREINISKNKIEKMTLIILKIVAKSKKGSKLPIFKVFSDLTTCSELNLGSSTYFVYLIWKCNRWVPINYSNPLRNKITVEASVYLLKVCNLLLVVSKLSNVKKLMGHCKLESLWSDG